MQTAKIAPTKPELKSFFEAGLSLDQNSRVSALSQIAGWYENSMPFYRSRFGPAEEKAMQRGLKAAELGRGGQSLDEKETALRTAIRMYEKALPAALALPKVEEDIYKRLDEDRATLEAKAAKLEAKRLAEEARLQEELNALSQAFGPLGLSFRIDPTGKTSGRAFNLQTRTLTYSPAALEAQRVAGFGALPLVLQEMEAALKASAAETDSSGRPFLNQSRLLPNLSRMAQGLLGWLSGQPVPFADPSQVAPGTTPPPPAPKPAPSRPPTQPRSQRGSASGNPYRGMKAQLFDNLVANSGQRVHLSQIIAGVACADPRRMLGHILEDGKKNGRWTMSIGRSGWIDFNLS